MVLVVVLIGVVVVIKLEVEVVNAIGDDFTVVVAVEVVLFVDSVIDVVVIKISFVVIVVLIEVEKLVRLSVIFDVAVVVLIVLKQSIVDRFSLRLFFLYESFSSHSM